MAVHHLVIRRLLLVEVDIHAHFDVPVFLHSLLLSHVENHDDRIVTVDEEAEFQRFYLELQGR